MFDKIIAHTSFIGETGYANHSRNFFTALNKIIPVKVRNFAVGKTWHGLGNGEPHNNEWYLTDEHKEMLYKQTCMDNDSKRTDHYIYGGDEEVEKGNNLHIVLNEVNHHYFYDDYDGPKIAYNVWESTLYPKDFFNRLLGFDQLWVPTKWQKDCVIDQGYLEGKVRVVPEAVDGKIFFPENILKENSLDEYKDDRFKFLLFGRWDYRKSTTEIIKSFLQTFGKDEPVDLVVSIDNPFFADGIKTTEDRLKHYGFDDERIKVKHFPSREDYIKYLKQGQVFLSCARSEGWNLPLIEAMACGSPSLYSNWGAQLEFADKKGIPIKINGEVSAYVGANEYFLDSTPGYYCEPDFDDLSKKMRDAYENYEDYKKKSIDDSKELREKFTWEKMAGKAYKIVEDICGDSCDGSDEVLISHLLNTIKIFKSEGRVKVEILGSSKQSYLIDFSNRDTNYCYYNTYISSNCFAVERIGDDEYPSTLNIKIFSENFDYFIVSYDKIKETFTYVKADKESKFLSKVKPPIIISGSPGSGTSFVSKLLRYCGVYFGTDSGDIRTRKCHESGIFSSIVRPLFVKREEEKVRYLNEKKEDDVDEFLNDINENIDKYEDIFRKRLKGSFDRFWGDEECDVNWGWKIPVNSLVLPLWYKIFPEAKFLIVNRDVENGKQLYSAKQEGNWLFKKSTESIRNKYMNPNIDKNADTRKVDFDTIISDLSYFNDVLSWCGLEPLNKDEFIKLKKDAHMGEVITTHSDNKRFVDGSIDQPLFSIVTSFYNNTEEEILDVSESVLSQDYINWEWIITDDFSDNKSNRILDLCKKDKRIKYIEQSEKQEIYWNPHKYANGEMICVLDSDDRLLPKALSVLNNLYKNNPDCVLIHTNSNHFKDNFDNSNYLKSRYCVYPDDVTNFLSFHQKFYEDHKYRFGECWGGMRTFRNVIDEEYDFREGEVFSFSKSEDLLKVLKLEEIGKTLYSERPLHEVRVSEGGHNGVINNNYEQMWNLAKNRRGDVVVDSINRKYSAVSDKIYSFYKSNLCYEVDRKVVSCNNFLCNEHEIDLIRELYFDHDIIFDKEIEADYYFYIMNEDVEVTSCVDSILNSSITGTEVCIKINDFYNKTFVDSVFDCLKSKNVKYHWYAYADSILYIYLDREKVNYGFVVTKVDDNEEFNPNVHFQCKIEGEYNVVLKDSLNDFQLYSSKMNLKKGVAYWVRPGGQRKYLNGILLEIEKNDKVVFSYKKEFHNRYPFIVNGENIKLSYPKSDGEWFVFYEIFIQETYNHKNCFVENGDVILDIGANYGIFDLYAVNKGVSKIYAYEPVKKTYKYCKKNTIKYPNVEVFNSAIGEKDEKKIINVCENSLGTSHIPDENNPFKKDKVKYKDEEIDIVSINGVLEKNKDINFIKIDCEGYEYNIFEAMDDSFLVDNIKKVIGEYHFDDGENLKKILLKLKRCGFEIDTIADDNINCGMFYAWKKETENLSIIVNAFADTDRKKGILKQCVEKLKKTGIEIILSSHYPVEKDVLELVDYYVYDSHNPSIKTGDSDYYWYANDNILFRSKAFCIGGHALAALTSLQNGVRFAKSIGKNFFYNIEYDNIIGDSDVDKFEVLRKDIAKRGKKGYVEDYFLRGDREKGISMLFFAFEVDYFLEYFSVTRDIEEYVDVCKGGISSELYLYSLFKGQMDDIVIGKREGIKISFFHDVSKALCDVREMEYIDIVPLKDNRDRMFLFNLNKTKEKRDYKIYKNDIFYKEFSLLSNGYHYQEVGGEDVISVKIGEEVIFKDSVLDKKQGREVDEFLDIKNRKDKYLISFDSSSLGDNIAWIPYAEEFRKKHNCKVILSTFWNHLFEKEYPKIEFVNRGKVVHNIQGQYNIGWYTPWDSNKNPNDFRTIPLQQTATDILGLDYEEVRPKITIPDSPRTIDGKYVCIGIHSTAQCKYWNYPGGWQDIVDYLKENGYKVVLIHKEQGLYMGNASPGGVIDKSGDIPIEDRMVDLKYADMFIGIGSGLSWLSWAIGTPTVLISGFSKPYCEFSSNVQRIHNNTVCNGCFNDCNETFDPGDWNWCPRGKSFECTKEISPEMVKVGINLILREKYGEF